MSIIIVGGGKFGLKAIEYVKKNKLSAILIDKDPHCQAIQLIEKKYDNFKDFKEEIKHLTNDTVYYIKDEFTIINDLLLSIDVNYIIPVIPIHLMASIISYFLLEKSLDLIVDKENTLDFINNGNPDLILSFKIDQGIVFLSHAKNNESCPDNCMGPPNYCPHFKREKSITITQYLRDYFEIDNYIDINEENPMKIKIIFESYQLKPGLGGLKGIEVKNIFKILNQKLALIMERKSEITIATTCNCHGVINFLKKNKME
ncbi:MAG: hypothetical protein ACFFBP_06275 [Promethearchaeota archaeon]